MRKFLKILLYVFLLALLVGAIALLVIWRQWPWWFGVAIFLGVVGVWVAILYIRKYFLRKREREFVRRVIAQDTAAIQAAPLHEREQLQDLQTKWQESVERLRASKLRKRGNPLYVLPWFLVIGESGAGKTSAIKNATLSTPLADTVRTAGLAATRNCEWWFFDQAIVLDTAGRYTIPVDPGPDREEWEKFLTLLAQYRRREPLNGLVVAIAADRLLAEDAARLHADGEDVRQRIDQVMRVVGARFPIYILVTKMDLVHGMVPFCRHLPPDRLTQAMGFINEQQTFRWKDVLDQAMTVVGRRLRQLRFILVHQTPEAEAGALLFPAEFSRLTGGLHHFLRAVFGDNPYQETPLLRGICFSSARQGEPPVSDFLRSTGLDSAARPSGTREDGYFLKDIFKEVLPADRYVYRPLPELIRWRRLTRTLGFAAWGLLWAFLCGLLSLAFHLNVQTINEFKEEFDDPPTLTEDATTNLLMLDRMRLELIDLQTANQDWWVPRFGLNQSLILETRVRAHFVRLFRGGFLIPLDESLARRIDAVTPQTSEEEMADYVGYVVTRISLIRDYLRGEAPSPDKPPPAVNEFRRATTDLLELEYPTLPPAIAAKFGDIYYTYLYWFTDKLEREQKVRELQHLLLRLLQHKGSNLHWLVKSWIPDSPDVDLINFWPTPEQDYDLTMFVPGAFTAAGRRNIDSFIRQIDAVLADPSVIDESKKEFWEWYRTEFYTSWTRFAAGFASARDGMRTSQGRERLATLMTTDQNPFFLLIQRMAQELTQLEDPLPPVWVAPLVELAAIQKMAAEQQPQPKTTSGLVDRLKQEEKKLVKKFEEKIDPEQARLAERRTTEVKIWKSYLAALQNIAPAVISRETCFHMISDYFPENFTPGQTAETGAKSPFNQAHASLGSLYGMVETQGDPAVAWSLVQAPLDQALDYCMMETGCALQEQWREQVMGGLDSVESEKLPRVLFDEKEGRVWKFLKSTARPFIRQDQFGYAPRVVAGRTIAFRDDWIQFLNTGNQAMFQYQPSYIVQIEAQPVDANADAAVKPLGCTLCLQCSDTRTCLENFNYPQSAAFKWSPDGCGDTTLTIQFPNLILTRTYAGRFGFSKFLAEFMTGRQEFRAEDFPDATARLRQLGVSWIRVTYRITGGEPVIRMLRRAPTTVPPEIVVCWPLQPAAGM